MQVTLRTVRLCAQEFQYQWTWMIRQKRENPTLAVARMWLEFTLAQYKVHRRIPR
jgi:hypothetical protein